MQALTLALEGVRLELAPFRDDLSWFEVRGWLGLSYSFDYPEDSTQQRRVERLVETEQNRYFERKFRPENRRMAWLRKRYDPDDREADYGTCSDAELLEELRVAAARERECYSEEDADGFAVYAAKRWPIVSALKQRPHYQAILEEMTGDVSRALRLLAAQLLFLTPLSELTLKKLSAENVGPEAQEARRILKTLRRIAALPKPWVDEKSP